MTETEAIAYRLQQAERHIEKLDTEIAQMRADAAARERDRLKWGIGAVGFVAMTLFGIIWQYRVAIFK